jgi:hypothetical protein
MVKSLCLGLSVRKYRQKTLKEVPFLINARDLSRALCSPRTRRVDAQRLNRDARLANSVVPLQDHHTHAFEDSHIPMNVPIAL